MEMNRSASGSGGGTTRAAVEDVDVEAVVGLPDLTDDDDDDLEDEYSDEDEEEEEGGHYKYKNQSYENGTRNKSNYVALLGPQLARVSFSMTSEDFAQTWYHKNATRNDAMSLLKGKPPGTFLIRPRSGCYAMTFVAEKGLIKHNLIYGLFPGYSLTEKPASDKDKFWNLTSLIRNCDFLRYPLSKEQPRAQTRPNNPSKNTTKSSIEVVARVVELLEQNMTSLTTLSWCLSVTQCSSQLLRGMGWDNSLGGNQLGGVMGMDLYAAAAAPFMNDFRLPTTGGANAGGGNGARGGRAGGGAVGGVEKRTFVRYCGKEYVAPELLPLQDNAAMVILEALAYNETLVSLTVLGEEGSFMNLNFSPNFTDKEAGWLADALRVNTNLTNVDLSVNSITDAGAVALAKVLSTSNRSVRLLDLSHNFIGKEGLIALAGVLKVNRHVQDLRIGNQHQWNSALHTVVLRTDPYERSVSRMIENALERKRELMENAGTYFHGFVTLAQARALLQREREGSFFFHLNENLPNCLIVSFVASSSSPSPPSTAIASSRATTATGSTVVRHRALYKTDVGYSFDRGHQRSILPLLDYCAWKISGNEALCRRFQRHPVSQQADIVEKLEGMKDLFPLWKISGDVSSTDCSSGSSSSSSSASSLSSSSAAATVFPTMPYVVHKNRQWLVHPVLLTTKHSP